jgi:hypothetical protein
VAELSIVERPSLTERVAAGAAWLDEHLPGWPQRISLTDLDMADDCGCVLGQILGRYDEIFVSNDVLPPLDEVEAVRFGFDVTSRFGDPALWAGEFAALQREWRRLIESRRTAVILGA